MRWCFDKIKHFNAFSFFYLVGVLCVSMYMYIFISL